MVSRCQSGFRATYSRQSVSCDPSEYGWLDSSVEIRVYTATRVGVVSMSVLSGRLGAAVVGLTTNECGQDANRSVEVGLGEWNTPHAPNHVCSLRAAPSAVRRCRHRLTSPASRAYRLYQRTDTTS